MSTDSTRTSGSSLINISKRIYNKVISNISPFLGKGMIFIDILKLCLGRRDSSAHDSSIIHCGMMDYYFIFIQVNPFWPLEIIPI
jgi:hypothetical protein